ncbi:MAG: DNA replication/repair protein RecF [Spirochaetia bacterium]
MAFTSITSYSYRNLQDQKVALNARRIFLVGENGQGKSNFLEAVYLLSYGSSFRTKRESELITRGKREMALNGRYIRPEEDDVEGTVAFKLATGSNGSGSKEKSIELDGKRLQDRKQLISHIPAIVFSHDDIYFVNGPPERRRWFFNQTMSLFDPMFIDTLRDYSKILKMRNLALKEQRHELIPVYDQQLAAAGIEIQRRRTEVIREYNQVVAPIFSTVSTISEPLSIEYRPSWPLSPASDQVCDYLAEKREQDLLYGTTSSGPHRDRFVFRLAGADFSRIASTGQLRLMSLILRLGQCRYFSQKTGRRPILLLDDVLLELDGERRRRFLAHLPDFEQAFFTFLPDEKYFDLAQGAGENAGGTTATDGQYESETAIFWVENGWIRKMNTEQTARTTQTDPKT